MPPAAGSATVSTMTYLMTTNTDGNLDIFRAIAKKLDPQTTGLIARYAGLNELGLAVTSVWETKVACDRFTADQLLPALQAVLGDPIPASQVNQVVGFESVEEFHPPLERKE